MPQFNCLEVLQEDLIGSFPSPNSMEKIYLGHKYYLELETSEVDIRFISR